MRIRIVKEGFTTDDDARKLAAQLANTGAGQSVSSRINSVKDLARFIEVLIEELIGKENESFLNQVKSSSYFKNLNTNLNAAQGDKVDGFEPPKKSNKP